MTFAATILTLYPEMFPGPLGISLAGRALARGDWACEAVQIRDFATDRHLTVDDTPAGGGAGMVLKPDILAAALDSVAPGRPVLAMTPRGRPITQQRIREIAAAADPQTRTYAARVALDDAAAADVSLGQSARVIIIDANAAGSLRVPLAAVQRGDNGGGSLWVVDDAGQVRQRPVKLGAFGEDTVPVLSGLRASEWVVAGGGHLLREGEQVNPVDRRNRPVGAAAAPAAPVAKQAR